MSFLTINGITLPTLLGSYAEQPREVGSTGPAYSGLLRRSRRALKTDCSLETPPLDSATSYAWRKLIQGFGDVWPWDATFYSGKGVAPTSTTGFAITVAESVYGGGSLWCTAAAGPPMMDVIIPTNPSGTFTVMGWFKENAGPWQHVIFTDSAMWVDGLPVAYAPTNYGMSVLANLLTFTGHVTNEFYWDDTVALPFAVPSTWPAGLYAHALNVGAYTPPVALALAGEAMVDSRIVMGNVTEVPMVAKGGARLSTLTVQLVEV